ncbi:MAG TPA: hypothetical protein VF316_03780 [Polyangiaceae bacterium]
MSPFLAGSLAAVVLLALGGGCFERSLRVSPPASPPVAPPSATAAAAQASAALLHGRHTTLGPRVDLDDVEGIDPSSAKAAFQSTAVAMRACQPGSGGAVRIRVIHEKGSTRMHVEDSSSVDGATRHCVLEALSTVDVADVASQASPSNRVSGFSSLVTVGW